MLDSGTSYSPGNYKLCSKSHFTSTERSVRDRVGNLTSSSQAWHRGDSPFPGTERSVREIDQRSSTGRPVRGIQNQLSEVKLDHHNLQVSDFRYIEKVLTNFRQKLNRREGDQMLDQRVNVLIWRLLSTTMKAAIHLGENYNQHLEGYRNTNFDALKTLFDITQKLILNQNHEILNVRDLLCYMTKHSSGRKQRYVSAQTQFFVGEGCMDIQRPKKS